jgi:hypothetical protein
MLMLPVPLKLIDQLSAPVPTGLARPAGTLPSIDPTRWTATGSVRPDMKIMGETSMHWTRLVLSVSAVAAVIALSGCDPQPNTAGSTTSPAPAASSTAPTSNSVNDAATAKACNDIKKDIKDNADKVAKAEKIGPPAGNIAVSAQWSAGSAAVIAHSIGANETVSAAADAVQKEMMNLGDEYNKSANAKPSKEKLEAAIKDLNAACSAT